MHNPIFIHRDPLLAGNYLLGDFVFSEDVRLESASLMGIPPVSGTVVITMEVAGALTEKTFTLLPSELSEISQSLTLGIKLSAGQSLRWRVTTAPDSVENTANHLAITMTARREADVVVPDELMTVWWRDGLERFKLFTYDPDADVYTPVNAALASTRAGITAGATFSITIQGGEVLRVQSSTLYTDKLVAGGLDLADQPQLQFYAGNTPLAVLTADGALHVPGMTEAAPVAQVNQFLLGSGAALNASGLTAQHFEQPL